MHRTTKLVNIIGAPGHGKTTFAHDLFRRFRQSGVQAEFVHEAAKEWVLDGAPHILANQLLLLAQGYHQIWRVIGKVDVVVCDSPLLHTLLYCSDEYLSNYTRHLIDNTCKDNTFNFFVTKSTNIAHEDYGRVHSAEQSDELSQQLIAIMTKCGYSYRSVYPNEAKFAFELVMDDYNTSD